MHKKGITEEGNWHVYIICQIPLKVAKKRTRRTVKYQRAVVGATWDEIKAKRTQKPEERQQVRAAAINKAKEQKKQELAKKVVERKVCYPYNVHDYDWTVRVLQSQSNVKVTKNAKAARPSKAQASSKR